MNVNSSRAPGSAQREAILVAATAAFLRYGFKKTSMDDVARAAGVSRQGLYLYFDTKDLLFRESLQHLVSHLISAARAVAEDGNLSLRDRLVGAFEAVHCSAFHNASREDALELLQELLGLPAPVYHHHRLLLDDSGQKLSKSTRATALRELRAQGITPDDIRMMAGLSDE